MSEDELVPLAPLPADVAATIGGIALSPWPTTLEELGGITGVGEKKLEQYGDALLGVVAASAA